MAFSYDGIDRPPGRTRIAPPKDTPGIVFAPRCPHPHPKWPDRACGQKLAEWAPEGFGIRCSRCGRLVTG